jgi:hypothetical protein
MQIRKSLKKIAVKICAIANRVFPFVQAATAAGDDCLLVVNDQLMIACRVSADKDGCYRLFVYDQITGNELSVVEHSFVDRGKAIAKARSLVHGSDSPFARQGPSDSATAWQAQRLMDTNPSFAIESERLFLRAKFSANRISSGNERVNYPAVK